MGQPEWLRLHKAAPGPRKATSDHDRGEGVSLLPSLGEGALQVGPVGTRKGNAS